MTFERFAVVVVPFPFSDRAGARRRPALVISHERFNRSHGQLVLAMITTAARGDWPSDTPIADLAAAGLRANSVVRLKLFTIDRTLVAARIGRLSDTDGDAVRAGLQAAVG